MALLVQKNRTETRYNMVKLQLYLHLFFNKIDLTQSELECATSLAIHGYDNQFYKKVVDRGVFKSEQSARNCMSKLKSANIIVKEDKVWKINPEISLGIADIICFQLRAKNDPE